MNKNLKYVLTAVGALVIGIVLGSWLIGGQSAESLGAALGITRYPNSGIAARFGYFGTSMPTTAQTDGSLQATGATTLTSLSAGTSTLGNTTEGSGVLPITISTTTPASTLTAAQVCGYGGFTVSALGAGSITTGTVTFAAATTTFTNCLTVDGAHKRLSIRNIGQTTSTITFAGGTGDSLYKPINPSSTLTVVGGQVATVDLWRDSSTTLQISFIQGF